MLNFNYYLNNGSMSELKRKKWTKSLQWINLQKKKKKTDQKPMKFEKKTNVISQKLMEKKNIYIHRR